MITSKEVLDWIEHEYGDLSRESMNRFVDKHTKRTVLFELYRYVGDGTYRHRVVKCKIPENEAPRLSHLPRSSYEYDSWLVIAEGKVLKNRNGAIYSEQS